jgi:outer membrane protein assembly factor BamE
MQSFTSPVHYSETGFVSNSRTSCLVLILALVLSACGQVKIPWVYRIDIQQGNVITQAQLAKLESGMERRKVRFILGTPLVTDAFNLDRWDYYYSYEPGNGERVQRIISVFFDDKGLKRVGGNVLAASGPIIVDERRDLLVKVPPGLNDEGLFASLTPSFLANRKKTIDLAKLDQSTSQTTEGPKQEDFQAPEIEITESDRDFLKGLLQNYGRTGVLATNPGSTVSGTPDQVGNPPTVSDSEQTESSSEGLFSRWAKKLGLKDAEENQTPEVPDSSVEPDATGTKLPAVESTDD